MIYWLIMVTESKEDFKNIPWNKGISALWSIVKHEKKALIFLGVLGIISSIANGSVPYITGLFFDALSEAAQGMSPVTAVYTVLIVWAVVQIIASAVGWYSEHFFRPVDSRLEMGIQNRGLLHLLRLPMSFHKRERIADVIDVASRSGWMCTNAIRAVVDIGPQLLSVIIGITIAFTINVPLAFLLVLGAFVYSLVLTRVIGQSGSVFYIGHKAWNKAWGETASMLGHLDTVKSFASEEYEEKRSSKAFMVTAFGQWMKMENIWSRIGLFQRIIVFTVQGTILLSAVFLVTNGSITIGELVAFNGYALMFLGPFVSLGHRWQGIQNGIVSAIRLKERILDQEPEVYEPENAVSVKNLKGIVAFENASFRYDDGDDDVLKDLTFEALPGETVAFVGESGGGKSTIIGLILGFYFPTKGKITIDGVDTRKLKLTQFRSQVAVVPQEVALFNDTVEKNIKYGTFGVSKEKVEVAARVAQIHKYVKSLPKGYKTLVGERGVKLSVGQKQRVAVARAVLRDPRILILDEPTSALDSKTEHELTNALEKLMKGRTTFIIAHRLSTVRKADKIVVLEKGRVAEIGSHDELVKRKDSVYRKLYEQHIGLRE